MKAFTLADAVSFATEAHAGQTDKAGRPYIEHPLRVKAALASESEQVQMVAVLHDVIEDCDLTLKDLLDAGVPIPAVRAVGALTKWSSSGTYRQYLTVVAGNPIAAKVKAADIADNADESRLALLDEATAARLRAKYERGRYILAELVAERGRTL